MMTDYILEVCVDSVESALAAKAGGATRLELCANLIIGGTTPGYTLFRQVQQETGLPIRVLIRPRFGDFLYTAYEYQQMCADIRFFANAAADGVVIGSLQADGGLNEAQMRGMIDATDGRCGITLHRAFDVCVDPIACYEKAAELGIDTILSSGQEGDALAGSELLRKLVQMSEENRYASGEARYSETSSALENAAAKHSPKTDRILTGTPTILVGAGVKADNIAEIAGVTGAYAFHMSGKKILSSGMRYRNEHVHMGLDGISEFELYRTDEAEIRRAVEILRCL